MSKLRSLNTCYWSDPWIETLSPYEKLLFIYLITNEKTNMLGIYEASIKKISFETGIENETVSKALKGFERVGKVNYINNHVILINFMKHQNFNPNMMKSAIDIYNNLPNELKVSNLDIDKKDYKKGFERLSKAMGTVRKVEVEVEDEREVEDEVKLEVEDEVKQKSEKDFSDSEIYLPELTTYKSEKEGKEKVALKRKDLTDTEMQQVLDFFNSKCEDLPNAQKLTKKRKTAIKNILKENSTKDLARVINLTSESDFLNARGSSDWNANFDWILKPNNFTKILEGNYENKVKKEKEGYLAGRQTKDSFVKNTNTILNTMLENTEK